MKISLKIITAVLLMVQCSLNAQSISNTVHNLSVSGTGSIKATSETEICIFCHTPHNSSPRKPLWNREDPGLNYTLYNSSTLQAAPGQPDGSSILCLSCHDGTIALGNILSRTSPIAMSGGITTMPVGNTNLSQDLSNDHPVSFIYDANLAIADPELVDPSTLTAPIHLENEKLQCTACHDPHSNINGQFLVATTRFSELCLYCHQKVSWDVASHRISNATWNGQGNDPWFHTPYTTVSENSCENCHNPHNAGGSFFLANHAVEERNCLDCHNGNSAQTDIQADLSKTYRHDVTIYSQVHDPQEEAVSQVLHVECADCHNPHVARDNSVSAPNANGFIEGVRGVNTDGNPVNQILYEYELCYRCHADSPSKPLGPISRQIEQNNVRFEFDLAGPSFHPVEGPGRNNNVPSLLSPYTESSYIYCTNCHASNGGGSPAGPHGSIYPQILKYRYETADYTPESVLVYELCYQCHDRNQIVNGMGRFERRVHRTHIDGEDTPCSACHDPHGISSSQGNSTNNTHLINFDLSIVQPNDNNQLEFVDLGNYSGECYLRCHNQNHNPEDY